jgi:hypothetical protein
MQQVGLASCVELLQNGPPLGEQLNKGGRGRVALGKLRDRRAHLALKVAHFRLAAIKTPAATHTSSIEGAGTAIG